jgi:hypothetical protein
MAKVDERTLANIDVLLEEVFGDVPRGGDHESRKHVAKKLIQSAKKVNGGPSYDRRPPCAQPIA